MGSSFSRKSVPRNFCQLSLIEGGEESVARDYQGKKVFLSFFCGKMVTELMRRRGSWNVFSKQKLFHDLQCFAILVNLTHRPLPKLDSINLSFLFLSLSLTVLLDLLGTPNQIQEEKYS